VTKNHFLALGGLRVSNADFQIRVDSMRSKLGSFTVRRINRKQVHCSYVRRLSRPGDARNK